MIDRVGHEPPNLRNLSVLQFKLILLQLLEADVC